MTRKDTKVEELANIIEQRQKQRETHRETGVSLGLSREIVREAVKQKRRKEQQITAGYISAAGFFFSLSIV